MHIGKKSCTSLLYYCCSRERRFPTYSPPLAESASSSYSYSESSPMVVSASCSYFHHWCQPSRWNEEPLKKSVGKSKKGPLCVVKLRMF